MDTNLLQKFKDKADTSGTLGIFSKTTDSSLIEAAGYAGLDFVIIDMEHGPASIETIQSHVRAAVISGLIPIVRVPDWSGSEISSVLDIGAMGIQVPNVTSVDQIRHVIETARFHPKGSRGVCRFVKAANYGEQNKNKYFQKANESLIIIQIEGTDALDSLDEIISIDGYDILFIGPYDLSQSLGVPGQIEHEKVLELMNSIIQKAHNEQKMIGIFVDTVEQLKNWKKLQLNYYAYSVDISLFVQSIKLTKAEFEK